MQMQFQFLLRSQFGRYAQRRPSSVDNPIKLPVDHNKAFHGWRILKLWLYVRRTYWIIKVNDREAANLERIIR